MQLHMSGLSYASPRAPAPICLTFIIFERAEDVNAKYEHPSCCDLPGDRQHIHPPAGLYEAVGEKTDILDED